MLSKETVARIHRDAQKHYRSVSQYSDHYIAGAYAEAERSAGEWVRADVRLPEIEGSYVIKNIETGWVRGIWYRIIGRSILRTHKKDWLWLDPSPTERAQDGEVLVAALKEAKRYMETVDLFMMPKEDGFVETIANASMNAAHIIDEALSKYNNSK